MSDSINGKPPTVFWIIAGVALVWNLIGFALYYMQVSATDEVLRAAYGEAEYEYLIKRLRYVAQLLGRPNPVPSREERRRMRSGVTHREPSL